MSSAFFRASQLLASVMPREKYEPTVVNLAKAFLQGLEVQLAGLARVKLGPKVLDPRIALILGLLEAMLHLGDQLGRAHSGGMSRRGCRPLVVSCEL
jgi:hypothetical protein